MKTQSNCACSTRGTLDEIKNWFTKQIKAFDYAIGSGPYGVTILDFQCNVNSEVTGYTCAFTASVVEGPMSDSKGRPNIGKIMTGQEIRLLLAECGLK